MLIPLQCEYYAMEGLAQLIRTIELVQERLNPALAVEGIVFTMFDGRTSLAAQVKSRCISIWAGQTFTTVIPRNVRLTEAPSHGRPVIPLRPEVVRAPSPTSSSPRRCLAHG